MQFTRLYVSHFGYSSLFILHFCSVLTFDLCFDLFSHFLFVSAVRLQTDRLSLIKECISQCSSAYRQSTLLLSLARLLRIAGKTEWKLPSPSGQRSVSVYPLQKNAWTEVFPATKIHQHCHRQPATAVTMKNTLISSWHRFSQGFVLVVSQLQSPKVINIFMPFQTDKTVVAEGSALQRLFLVD